MPFAKCPRLVWKQTELTFALWRGGGWSGGSGMEVAFTSILKGVPFQAGCSKSYCEELTSKRTLQKYVGETDFSWIWQMCYSKGNQGYEANIVK